MDIYEMTCKSTLEYDILYIMTLFQNIALTSAKLAS